MTIGRRDAAASTPLARRQRGQSELVIVWRPIAALKPDQENPRSHTPKQIRRLAASIESLGFNHPILVDREFRVIAGHGRLLACQELDWAEVPTIVIDHLSETQRRAFVIADNRLAENAGWDDQVLARQLKHLCLTELDFSIEATGFEIAEVELRVASLEPHSPAEASRDRANRASNRTGKRRKAGAKRPVCRDGEWWLLGTHRVHCGGAIDPVACATLMAEERADEGEASPNSVCVCVDPARADAIIRRWQTLTGGEARHAASSRSFDTLADERIATAGAGLLR